MYRRQLLIFTLTLLFCLAFIEPLQAQERVKATVSVIFINNAKTTYDDEISTKINNWLDGKVNGIYVVKSSDAAMVELRSKDIDDLMRAEKQDFVNYFGQTNVDYVIYAELQPLIRKEKITVFTYGKDMTATMYLRIIDVPNSKYLYNGKFIVKASDSTNEWHIGNKSVALMAIDKVLIEMGEVISFRLPLNPPIKLQ